MLVGQRDQRLERARELGQPKARGLGGQPAGPPDGGGLEALLVPGVEHEQDRQGVREGDVGQLGCGGVDQARLPERMARWKRE